MIIVQGTFTVDPDRRDEFLADRIETMQTSRAEKGCIEYVLAADPVVPGRVVLSERWETQADLDAHIAALMAKREAGGDESAVPLLSREVGFFEAIEIEL